MYEWLLSITQFLVAVGTFFLAAMVYKQILDSRRIQAREIHTKALQDFLTSWKDQIRRVYVMPESMHQRKEKAYSLPVETTPLFDDLERHLHKGSKLMESYAIYKALQTRFSEVAFELFSTIEKDSCAKTGMRLTGGDRMGLRREYIGKLHQQYLTFALKSEPFFREGVKAQIQGTAPNLSVVFDGSHIAWVTDSEKADMIVRVHGEMLRDFTNSRYQTPAENLIQIESSIDIEVASLRWEMDEVLAQPLVATDCKYIRRSLGKPSRLPRILRRDK